ncbi:MAG: hypothetical protein AAF957_03405 [Planctomycetota bacterium]
MRLPRVRRAASGASSAHAGFTLAEAAVTIAIVALVLTMMLQGLEGAKFSAAHNRYRKTAYELGVGMLGEISAGIWREELDSGSSGSFADLDEPDYFWEVALGDEVFETDGDEGEDRPHDNYASRREWERNQDDGDDEEDEENEEPFEKVKLRITYPKLSDYPDELVLETWIPWTQVYGEDEEEELSGGNNVGGPSGANGGGQGSGAENG